MLVMAKLKYTTTLLCATAALLYTANAGAAPDKPNILIILSDDVGYSDTEIFGGEIRTPNLKALADGGRRFTQFYNTARCCPSRASLLTGLYPHQAGVGHMLWNTGYPGYTTHLTSDSVTLAEALGTAGYRNYMVGKWHLSERVPDRADPKGWPLQRGFHSFYGTLQGYGSYYDPATLCRDTTYITPENDPDYKPDSYYYTDALSDNAVKYLQNHTAQHGDKPFLMYLAYTAAHWPLHVPEESMKEYKGKYDAGYEAIYNQRIARMKEMGLLTQVGQVPELPFKWNTVKDKAWEAQRMEAFAATITHMDTGIGRILEQLRASGQLDNTLVMYLQDNGGCDEEFFMIDKAPPNPRPMGADDLQDRTLLPMQTRDGKVVKAGPGVYTGPAESYNGYGPAWAQVSNAPFRKVKKYAHEGGISTPLVVNWPKAVTAANDNLVTAPGHLIDIMPTVLEAAGVHYPAEYNGHRIQPVEGKSLLPLLTGSGSFSRNQPLFWEHEGNRAIRDGKWKLVAAESKPWELYDLDTDRGETNDLAATHPDVATRLATEWNKYADRARVRPLGAHRLREPAPDPAGTSASLVLHTGDVYQRLYAPALSDRGVSITAHIATMAPDGVIVAHGGSANGYSLYMKQGKLHFTVVREKEVFTVSSTPADLKSSVSVSALLDRDGVMTLKVPGQDEARLDAYGPLLLTPNENLTCGFDQATPVGKYEGMFSFQGDISRVELETVK